MSERAATLLREWSARLQENALAARVLAALDARKGDVQRCALDGLQRANDAFRPAADEQFRNEAIGHCHDILNAMFAIATGRAAGLGADLFGFVRLHAIRRARQRFPLAGSLNAYRLAHKGYWTVMRDAVLDCGEDEQVVNACSMMLSEFLLDYFDVVSGILTDAYLAEARLLATRQARARVALVEDLLRGRQPGDVEACELAERCGIRGGARIAVAIARPLARAPGDDADREVVLLRLSELIETSLASSGLGALVDRRDGAILAIAAGEADTARRMTDTLRGCAADAAVGIGVSLDVSDIAAVPQAYQEADRAADFAEARTPVIHVADVDLVELLLRRPDAAALRLMPKWVDRFRAADGIKAGELSSTIRAFAECNLNVKQTARRLALHTNTVYFRLNRIRELTGVDPRSFSGASLLLTTLRLIEARTNGDGGHGGG